MYEELENELRVLEKKINTLHVQTLMSGKADSRNVLVEIHSFDELKKISSNDIDVIGVNNRNLDTLEVDISNSEKLFDKIPDQFVKISESGISKVESILRLREIGYQGFLIGENFMKTSDPMISAYNFIKKVENEI